MKFEKVICSILVSHIEDVLEYDKNDKVYIFLCKDHMKMF